jgi:hypothetical protein
MFIDKVEGNSPGVNGGATLGADLLETPAGWATSGDVTLAGRAYLRRAGGAVVSRTVRLVASWT